MKALHRYIDKQQTAIFNYVRVAYAKPFIQRRMKENDLAKAKGDLNSGSQRFLPSYGSFL